MDSITFNGIRYEWLVQSSMRISAPGAVIYTDPVALDDAPPAADLILISHHHVDHCLPEFVAPIRTEKTGVLAFHDSYVKHCARDIKGARTVKVGETVELSGVTVTGTEAYTRRGFHSKGEGCGFLISLCGQRIYFSGDTARVPEMASLGRIDVAVMAIADNTWTIDLEDIARAVREISPALVIPVHYTPMEAPEPTLAGEPYFSKDPAFFTKKEDPARLAGLLEGAGVDVVVLNRLAGGK